MKGKTRKMKTKTIILIFAMLLIAGKAVGQCTFTTQPVASSQICVGGSVTLTVAASGGETMNYQWFSNTSASNSGGTLIPSETSATYSVPTGTAGIYYFYCEATGTGASTCGPTPSSAATVTVNPATSIDSQSTGTQTQCIGGTFSPITVTSSGSGLTYQWYSNSTANNSGGTSLNASNGAQTSSYTPQSSTAGTLYYYCVVHSICGSDVTSAVSGAFIVNLATSISGQSTGTQTQCIGGTFTSISVTASGTGTLTYQWYSNTISNNSGGSIIVPATSASYTPSASTAGTLYYYCVVHSDCGSDVTSSVSGTFVVNPVTSIDSQSTDTQTQCIGESFSPITVTSSGSGLTYQWFYNSTASNSGGTSLNASNGAQTSSYTPQSSTAGTLYYYCVVHSICGSDVTSAVSGAFIVNPATSISGQSTGTQTQCIGGTYTSISVTASGTAPITYQWYSNTTASNSGGTGLGASNGAQTDTYTPQTTAAGTLYYYCIVHSSCGSNVTSSVSGAFIVNPATSLSGQSTATQTKCIGGTFSSISVTASGTAPLTYQWYKNSIASTSGGTSLGSSNGGQTNTYTPQASVAGTLYYYCIIHSNCGSDVTSAISGAFIVDPASNGGTLASAQTICHNTTPAPITVSGYTGSVIDWESSVDQDFSVPVSLGVTTATLTLGVHTVDMWYRVVIKSGSCNAVRSNNIKINVHHVLTSGISYAGTLPICYNSAPLVITASATGGDGTYTYAWKSSATGSTVLGTNSTYTPGNLTVNTDFWCDISSSCGPITTPHQTITVHPQLTLSSVSQESQICSGAKATINLTGLIGTSSAVTYQIGTDASVTKTGISVSGGVANFLTENLAAVNNGKTFTITGITNENTGCSATFTQSTLLIVNTATIPTLSGDLTPCINSTEVYTTQSGMNTNSYVWTFSGGGTYTGGGINDNTITVTWTSTGTKTISVNFTNSNGCTAASATTISPVVSALPTPAISGPSSACINSAGNVYSTLAGMSGYDWDITGGSITSGGDNSSFAVVTWTSAGSKSISVNYTNASGCAATLPTIYPVTVHPLPVVETPNTASTCSGTSPNISLTASVASTFTWTVGAISGSISGATSGSGSTINQVLGNASSSSAGTVQYLVTPTSTTGSCAGTPFSIVVTVYPLPVVTNSATTTICSGTSPNITLTSSVPGNFTWTVGTNTGGIVGATAGSGSTINQTLTNPSNTSAGSLQYLVTPTSTTGTCTGNTYSIVVTVNPTPVVTTSPTVSTCSGTAPNILLTASTQSTFTWTVGAISGSISGASAGTGSIINQVLSNPSNTVVGTVEYLVTPVSITGSCTGSALSIIVTVNPLPLPDLTGPLSVRITSTGNLYTTETGMSNYIWTVSSGGTVTAGGTTGTNSVAVTWNTTGLQSVSVKYTNTNNCTALAPTPVSVTVSSLPSVSSVGISGTPAIGSTLTGSYSYSDAGGGSSDISTFRWLRNGTAVSGAELDTYLLTGDDQNKSISFEVTPKTSAGTPNTGTPVISSPTIPVENLSEIPVADQVCIEGVRTAGNTLRGKYRYTHSKTEGLSTYKWYLNGVAIPSATGTQYTLLATDIDNDEEITFEVTPVSSNVIPVSGIPATSNPMAKMPLVPTDYSVAVSSVPLTASPSGGIFSGPGVTNGIFSPSTVGIGGSPYSIQYLLNIVNSSTSCSQSVWKTVNVVTNTTEFSSFKDVYCQTDDPDEIVVTGLLTGLTSLGFTLTDADAIVSSTAWTVTVDPRKMRPGNNRDYLNFRYKDALGIEYQISKSFVVDSVGTGLQIVNLGNEYCAETPKVSISVTGTYPSGGTGLWTSSVLSDLTATSASVNVALVPAGPAYPLSYRYTSPLGCKSIVINKSVTVNPLPNPAFSISPFYNIEGGAAALVPVQSPGTFSGNGVSGDKFYPDIAGLGEHTINYRIIDNKGCVDDLDIKTTVKKAQGTFTDIPAVICYRDTTFNVRVTGLPDGMSVSSFVNSRNSIKHIAGATDANYSVKAAGHGLDTLTLSYNLDGVGYWVSKVVNIDSLGVVQIQNLLAGDKICDNRAPFELFTSMPGGVFTGPVAGNYLDPTKATGETSLSYKYTNTRTGCSTSAMVPFSIIPAPQVAFLPRDVCIESNKDSTYFMNLTVSSDPIFEWTWTFAEVGAAPSNKKEPAFLYKNGGIHAVSLNARTVSGCTVTKTSSIDLGIRPIADFIWKNDCFAPGAKLNLTDATFTNFPVISRTWNFNNGSLISSDLNPEYAMQDTGYVHVKYIVRTSYANCADTVSKRVYLRPTITIPKDGFYYQNFEAGKAGWGKDDSDPNLIWSFGTPDRTKINKAKSGVAAWYTRYASDKQGKTDTTSVISPCFDFTNIQRPMITLQAFKIFEKNRNGAALQYKTEGSDWKYVGTLDDGINWYNSTLINGKPGGDKIGWTTLSEEKADVDYVPSSHALDELKGMKNVKFRLAYGSDGNSLDKEGIAFDDIWIGERTRKVLLEHFTNTFSKKGSEATAYVNKIIKVRDKDVVNIQYHTNFPDDDPFYLVNPGDASARIFSYGLSKVPYSLIDGGYSNVLYASLSDYKAAPLDSNDLSRRTLLDSKFAISVIPKVTGGVLTVESMVTAVAEFASDNLILYLAVTEKEAVSDKPAALGEVNFKNVFRKFIPDAGGIELKKKWTKGDTYSIAGKTWVIENIKNFSDIEVIAFIQNSQTKEVYQVTSVVLKTGKSVIDNSKLNKNAIGTENNILPAIITFGLYPNPASDKLRIEFSDKLASEADVRIFDFQGAVKKTYKVASGESELFIDDIGLKAGIYLVRISSGGVDLGFRKLIITGN
jgi:hypothetical protein